MKLNERSLIRQIYTFVFTRGIMTGDGPPCHINNDHSLKFLQLGTLLKHDISHVNLSFIYLVCYCFFKDIRAPDEHYFQTLNHNPQKNIPGAFIGK